MAFLRTVILPEPSWTLTYPSNKHGIVDLFTIEAKTHSPLDHLIQTELLLTSLINMRWLTSSLKKQNSFSTWLHEPSWTPTYLSNKHEMVDLFTVGAKTHSPLDHLIQTELLLTSSLWEPNSFFTWPDEPSWTPTYPFNKHEMVDLFTVGAKTHSPLDQMNQAELLLTPLINMRWLTSSL